MQNKSAIAVIFEVAYDAHISKDIIAVPIELGALLGNLPVYLFARPNPFQEKLATHIRLVPVGIPNLENNEALFYLREEGLKHSSQWYHEACLQAAEYANILFLIPHFADPCTISHAFWKKNRQNGRKATTYVKMDASAVNLRNQLKERRLVSGFKPTAKHIARRLQRVFLGRNICAFSAESSETLVLFKQLNPEFASRCLLVKNCPVFLDNMLPQPQDLLKRSHAFIAVARFGSPLKASDVLLKAWLIAAHNCPGWKLRLVGTAEKGFREEWSDILKQHNLQHTVQWIGLVSDREQLQKYYTDSRIFVLPSHSESSSTTLAESIVAGCAVICTPAGDAPLLLENFKQALVPFNDPFQLASAMELFAGSEKILSDQTRLLSSEARQRKWPEQLRPVAERIQVALA